MNPTTWIFPRHRGIAALGALLVSAGLLGGVCSLFATPADGAAAPAQVAVRNVAAGNHRL